MRFALIISVLMWVALFYVAGALSGCGVMGVRDMDLWGAKFTFAEGIDFHVGANAIDEVDDRRGVSPVSSYKSGYEKGNNKY